MMRVKDPFRASAGSTPPVMVGRGDILEDFECGLEIGVGAFERITMLVGPRGVGKTVVLNAIEDIARERSWHVFSMTAAPGFLDELTELIADELAKGDEGRKYLSSLNLGPFGIGIAQAEHDRTPTTHGIRKALTALFDAQDELDARVGQDGVGVLITVDELHRNSRDELIEFAVAIQHLVREGRNIAVAMAGIPSAVSPLLADDSGSNPITFLRRANRVELGPIDDDEVRRGLAEPVESAGVKWEEDALDKAVAACGGYAFMIQLVGSWCFRGADGKVITSDVAELGIAQAQRRLGRLVHEPALADLSDVDRTFLVAMAQDSDVSEVRDIAERMNASPQMVGKYRGRLMTAGVIDEAGRGKVRFALPYLADYLREHVASDVM